MFEENDKMFEEVDEVVDEVVESLVEGEVFGHMFEKIMCVEENIIKIERVKKLYDNDEHMTVGLTNPNGDLYLIQNEEDADDYLNETAILKQEYYDEVKEYGFKNNDKFFDNAIKYCDKLNEHIDQLKYVKENYGEVDVLNWMYCAYYRIEEEEDIDEKIQEVEDTIQACKITINKVYEVDYAELPDEDYY